MEQKEAKEIIRAGFAWANWNDEQKEAFKLAYEALDKVELLEKQINRFEYLVSYEYSYQIDNAKGSNSKYHEGALAGMENYNRKWKEATKRDIKAMW
ncbi:hypothetical protein HYI36_05115 [Bacillus sp. Gen3]|uniref:hypothetical protein n=1 Tax=Heyndrickxia oleronia TaxID=38875 RepID=UPI0015D21CEB|nr:hypothetical protein [Heyndrickxia oleronia]NYV64627.1 hypothetical protein [Bacillus sp. Gen3]GIN38397.1 hypothetical protein J19TS1_13460 [Heyndrickxia oleronia]